LNNIVSTGENGCIKVGSLIVFEWYCFHTTLWLFSNGLIPRILTIQYQQDAGAVFKWDSPVYSLRASLLQYMMALFW